MDDRLLDQLASDAQPVRRVDSRLFVLLHVAAALASLLIVAAIGIRADFAVAITNPVFYWKAAAMLAIAAIALPLLLEAGLPGADRRRSTRWMAAAAAGLILLPCVYALVTQPSEASIRGLALDRGLGCVLATAAASVPVWIASLAWLRASAPTDLARAAWLAGFASASVGATLFVLHCPFDEIVYVAVWYGLAILGIAATTRRLLPRLIRW